MAWSYRKRIKVIPGVRLNISKSGISTSIGVRGANMTFGKTGTYLNTGIPGTGLYNRQKLSGSRNNSSPNDFNPQPIQTTEFADNIFSTDIQEITSEGMQGIKEAIIAAHDQRIELKRDLVKVRSSLTASTITLTLTYLFLIGLIKKSISADIKTDIKAKKDALKRLAEQIETCYVDLDIELDPDIKGNYDEVVYAFKNLCNSKKIWDVTGAHYENTKVTRSAASTVVRKREVSFGIRRIEDIKCRFEPLLLKNANGADLYIYPNFIVIYSSQKKFALVGLHEIRITHNAVRFVETGSIPGDTKVIDKTWAKVNKNGSPDKRFKGNYQIPIVRYGEINLRTDTGLNEEFQFSNYEFSEHFASAFSDFQNTIKNLKEIPG